MIADAIGVTKAAVYHQYNTKDEIVLAVAEVVLAGLEAAVTAAEAERSRSRAREVLIAAMIDLAVERRRMASILQRDPVMLRFLEEHEPFRRVMERVNRVLMGGALGRPGTRSGGDARGGHRRGRHPPARPGSRRRDASAPSS